MASRRTTGFDTPESPGEVRLLPVGALFWVRARGRSMWPLLLEGDGLGFERVAPQSIRAGDVGVFAGPGDVLIAHVVAVVGPPTRTCTAMGVRDAYLGDALGRLVAVQRGPRVLSIPPSLRLGVRAFPLLARAARRLPFAIPLIRLLRGW